MKNPDIPDNELLRLYPVGKKVTVYYDPKDPTYCLLEPGISYQSYIAFIIGVVFIIIGIVIAVVYKPVKLTQ